MTGSSASRPLANQKANCYCAPNAIRCVGIMVFSRTRHRVSRPGSASAPPSVLTRDCRVQISSGEDISLPSDHCPSSIWLILWSNSPIWDPNLACEQPCNVLEVPHDPANALHPDRLKPLLEQLLAIHSAPGLERREGRSVIPRQQGPSKFSADKITPAPGQHSPHGAASISFNRQL